MSGKMLKTIRKAIVGMMNRLRMVMSLKPRRAAGEPGSSVLSTYLSLPGARAVNRPRRRSSRARPAASPGPAAEAAWLRDPRDRRRLVALVFLERGFPVVGQPVEGFLGRALVAGDERMHALVHLLQEF